MTETYLKFDLVLVLCFVLPGVLTGLCVHTVQETVAAYEAKYNRLKSRYRELAELHREEVDKLHDEIGTLQERVVELEALAAQLEAAR
jgi:predicted nuclease with TOPRIM domain